jgi:putative ABC transport system permease protein
MNIDLFAFALRNVFRHRARSAGTLAAIAIGVAGLILAGGFVKDIFIQLGEAIIHSQTGHIQITAEGFRDGKNREPDKYLIRSPAELGKQIQALSPSIAFTMARLNFAGVLNNGRRDLGIIGEGIEPDAEQKAGTFLNYIEGRPLNSSDTGSVVVGEGVAKSLGLRVGDRITLVITLAAGAVNTLDFELVGIFQSFSRDFDARAVRIPLPAAMELMDTQAANVIIAMLDHTEDTNSTVKLLKQHFSEKELDAIAWNELSDFYEKTVDLYDRQFGVLRLIILVMVLLSVVNSVNMTLFERTREFGTLRAIGDRSTDIFRLIVAECACLGFIGALTGMLLGSLMGLLISAIGIPMPPPPNANLGYTALIRLDTISVLSAGIIGFSACLLASLLPAHRASKLDIGEALRHGV